MISKSTAAVAPLVSLKKEGEDQRLNVEGCAVFKESKMVGEFGKDETKGLLLVNGNFKSGILRVDALGATAAMEIRKVKSKIKPELKKDGSVKITVEVDELVGLGDQTGTVNLSEAENTVALNEAVKHESERIIWRAVDKSRELNADVFGFGESVGRKYPKEWKELEKKWGEKYKDIEVELIVKVKGDGSGRLNAPLIPSKD
jgi:spore germination protein KC